MYNLLISYYLSILFDVLHEKFGSGANLLRVDIKPSLNGQGSQKIFDTLARIEAQGYLLIRSLFMLNMQLEDVLINYNVEF